MCDSCDYKGARWKGWRPLPKSEICQPAGDWVDLSHCLTEELSRISLLPPPTFRRVTSLPKDHANVTEINMVAHVGTHLDAPCHFVIDAPSAEQVPLERLCGRGVVVRIDVEPLAEIMVEHLKNAPPGIQRGDIVIISTGWAKHINTPLYEDHPALSTDAAEWLVGMDVKLVAVDFSTPDLTVHKRPPDFTWPVHQILLANGVLIAEHMTNLDSLENSAVEAMFLGLNIRGSDGMPARIAARPIR